jgi:hypothetical protein
MNGAIAEPCVKMISPPKITIMSKMGMSQNFLRTFRKPQSSIKNDMPDPAPSQYWFFIVPTGCSRSIQ